MEIKLHLDKSLEENAGIYFDKAKKLRKKLEGAQDTIEETKVKIGKWRKDLPPPEEEAPPPRQKKWFEKFRWFYSSDGFLCLGGRDATTNEILIKKHTEKDDIVFHTDMAGSPFFVIKTEGKDVPRSTLDQVADATMTFSKAWQLGLQNLSVFHVEPSQVSKEAQSGEHIPRGAFMIRGKLNYHDSTLNLAVGKYEDTIMAGPLDAVKAHDPKAISLAPGKSKASSIAKEIRKLIKVPLDDIIRVLPSGGFAKKR
jgi:predicted ribosome quality control (RQC) complex YloA/Tae2 family protein